MEEPGGLQSMGYRSKNFQIQNGQSTGQGMDKALADMKLFSEICLSTNLTQWSNCTILFFFLSLNVMPIGISHQEFCLLWEVNCSHEEGLRTRKELGLERKQRRLKAGLLSSSESLWPSPWPWPKSWCPLGLGLSLLPLSILSSSLSFPPYSIPETHELVKLTIHHREGRSLGPVGLLPYALKSYGWDTQQLLQNIQ